MSIKSKKSRQSGKFVVSRDREIYGELTLSGASTALYLHDKEFFSTHDVRQQWIRGVLHDLSKVSLIDCVAPSAGTVSHGAEGYHYANIFPNFVVYGDYHLNPDENVINAVEFLIDDANVLFCDHDAFGWLHDAQPFIEQVANANKHDRRVVTGPDAQIIYFAGKSEVFSAKTALGKVSGIRSPAPSFGGSGAWAFKNRIFVSIDFEQEIAFRESISRTSRLVEYLGMLVGRPQNLLGHSLHVKLDREKEIVLPVHWSSPPRRNRSSESPKPGSFDVLLDAVRQPEAFARVLENWLDRQKDWHNARWRFFNSFAQQRRYDIDRLIASANMFDILPASAVPADAELTPELKDAQSDGRRLFCDLAASPERDSILGALGRIGKSNLKMKVRHRAQQLIRLCSEWFPEILTVTDEAINCRNYYVHGGNPRFDYDRNFGAVMFFTNTLEFVFAISDLVEAGWDVRSWILKGTTMSHPFGRYRANYAKALQSLKTLVPKPAIRD